MRQHGYDDSMGCGALATEVAHADECTEVEVESRPTVSLRAAGPGRPLASTSTRAVDPGRTTVSLRAIDPPGEPRREPRCSDIDPRDLEQTRVTLEQIIEHESRDLDLVEAYIRVLVDLGRFEQACGELLWLAMFHADRGRLDEALHAIAYAQHLEPARMVSQSLAPLMPRLGPYGCLVCERAFEEHLAASRLEAARDLLELLVTIEPTHTDAHHRLAKLELMLGRTPSALVHLRTAIDHYRDERRVALFVRAAEEWLRHGGPDADLLWELTLAYLQADLPDRALAKLTALHRLLPADLEIVERIATLQARLGRAHATQGTLWRLIREMRNFGSDDELIRELLERARYWHDTSAHRASIDALARKVLSPKAKPASSTEGANAGRDYTTVTMPTVTQTVVMG